MTRRNASEKKQALINEVISKGLQPGDTILVRNDSYTVVEVGIDYVLAKCSESFRTDRSVKKFNNGEFEYNVYEIGANPFPKNDWRKKVRNINYNLESIIFTLFRDEVTGREEYEVDGHSVHETNFNPYVVVNGEKYYYQRPLVWTLKDKQNLIESIYLGISCGSIIVREHGWKEVETEFKNGNHEICFFDVVDGKQRLNAVYEFIRGDFPDLHGNYYNDLSDHAQMEFGDSMCFNYAVMGEKSTDEDVLSAFLGVNFTGVPQSTEHIAYVRGIYDKLEKE